MANYDEAFKKMIVNEDSSLSGIVKTDNDGGQVRFGLNSNAHPMLVAANFYTATRQEALLRAQFYYREWYWEPMKGDLMVDQGVANKVFDQCVPMGISQASKLVQRAINKAGHTQPQLKEDGVLGPLSIKALNASDPKEFLGDFRDVCTAFYQDVVTAHPEYAHLQDGWEKRLDKGLEWV